MTTNTLENRVAELEVQVDWLRQLVDQLYAQLPVSPPQYQPFVPAHPGPAPAVADQPPVDLTGVRAAIADGQLIMAIKLYREATGLGLAEAKKAVDAMAKG